MDTTELKLTRHELVALLCAVNESTVAALDAERQAQDEPTRRAARANTDVFMRLASRLRREEQVLSLRAAHYPPGKVVPPRPWPAAPERSAA